MIHHQSCFANSRILTRLSAILLLAVCSLTADTVKADLITVTIEAPAVQQSALATNPGLFGATDVHVENFDSLTSGSNPFAGNPAIGNYNSGNIVNADPVGGAGGTGKYLLVGLGSPVVLGFAAPQRYFGFWWSAGDAFNELQFYNSGNLLGSYTTANVIQFVAGNPAYNGNPTAPFFGQNPTEPYAFLNFFADCTNPNITFDEIRFINNGQFTGFESDNHTIASGYTQISGTVISGCGGIPEPTAAALLALAGLGMCFRRRR